MLVAAGLKRIHRPLAKLTSAAQVSTPGKSAVALTSWKRGIAKAGWAGITNDQTPLSTAAAALVEFKFGSPMPFGVLSPVIGPVMALCSVPAKWVTNAFRRFVPCN